LSVCDSCSQGSGPWKSAGLLQALANVGALFASKVKGRVSTEVIISTCIVDACIVIHCNTYNILKDKSAANYSVPWIPNLCKLKKGSQCCHLYRIDKLQPLVTQHVFTSIQEVLLCPVLLCPVLALVVSLCGTFGYLRRIILSCLLHFT